MNIQDQPYGDSLEIDVAVRSATGEPFPLDAPTTLIYSVRKKWRNNPRYTLTLGDGIEVIDQASSKVRINLPPDKLTILGEWIHSIEVRRGDFQQTMWTDAIMVVPTAKPQD